MPRAFATQRGEERRFLGGPQFQQLPDLGPHVPPLLPETHAQAATQPGVEFGQWAVVLREPKVVDPTPDVLVELVNAVGPGDAPTSPGELAQPVTKLLKGFGGPIDARAVEGKAQERALIGWSYCTLGLSDLQLEVLLEKPSQPGFDAPACPLAVDYDEEV